MTGAYHRKIRIVVDQFPQEHHFLIQIFRPDFPDDRTFRARHDYCECIMVSELVEMAQQGGAMRSIDQSKHGRKSMNVLCACELDKCVLPSM